MKTLFEDSIIKVYMNTSDEVFVLNKQTQVALRISASYISTTLTFDGIVVPSSINGKPAFMFKGE